MAQDYDLVIRGGTIIDGRGGEPFEADLAITENKIAALGKISGRGREEISAKGRIVTPGFVDPHTHYDGQVIWEGRLSPSSDHGVTTVVMGNCGIGFAPCRPQDRERLVHMMEGVEDIPESVLNAGLSWEWESFGEFLDAVDRRPHDVDVGALLPHSPLRIYVMGERAMEEPAREEDQARMAALAREAVIAGAAGFSTSRSVHHRTPEGKPIPSRGALPAELQAIVLGLKEAGAGVLEYSANFTQEEGILREFEELRRLAEISGRPVSYSIAQYDSAPDGWRTVLKLTEEANRANLPMRGQVIGRPAGGFVGLELSLNPFSTCPSYAAIEGLPLADKVKALRDPAMRARLLSETPGPSPESLFKASRLFDRLYPLGDPPDYEPAPETSVAAQAQRRGVTPLEMAYDLLLERDGHEMLYAPLANFCAGNLDVALALMRHPNTILGVGDGGAHVGMICDASYPTFMLTYWARDRARGDRLPLPWVVKALTQDCALAMGYLDRGLLAPGYKADVNVIDFERLALSPPRVAYDLPAHGRRLSQPARGYEATILSGKVTYRDGVSTGALPGRVVRGGRKGPKNAGRA